jgi:carbonic anhydrase
MNNNIDNQPRKLGSGFGPDNQFSVYLNEPNKGLINGLSPEKMAILHDWIAQHQKGSLITDVLDGRILAGLMPDLLVDMSLIHLAKILPPLMLDLPDEVRNAFTQEALLNKLDTRFLNSLNKSLPHVLPEGLKPSILIQLLSKESLKEMISHPDKDNPTDRAYLLAYLIPALLDLMEASQLEQASVEIAKRVAPKNFNAAADANYFDLQLTSQQHHITVENNGRTLIFRAQTEGSEPSLAKYRGRIWKLDHTHLHLERDGEEREYVLYESRQQKKDVDNNIQRDPNLDIVGEIHTVYKRLPKKYANLEAPARDAYWKYMAVAVPLKIGAFNQDFQDILNNLKQENKLSEDRTLELTKNFQEVFLRKFEASSVLYHSWGSLINKTYGFRSGLSFNILPATIEVDDKQYKRLTELFGSLIPLPEEKVLEPIDRKAGIRQIRKM